MKIRKGFVSNSSTSSFICEICGETIVAHDSCSMDDLEMTYCMNEHLICQEHLKDCDFETFKKETIKHISAKNKEWEAHNESVKNKPNSYRYNDFLDIALLEACTDEDCIKEILESYNYSDYGNEIPFSCPICMFEASSNSDISRYLLKKYGISRDEVFEEVKKSNKRRKKLYDSEYITYVYNKYNLSEDILLKELKDQFEVYSNFQAYLRESLA